MNLDTGSEWAVKSFPAGARDDLSDGKRPAPWLFAMQERRSHPHFVRDFHFAPYV